MRFFSSSKPVRNTIIVGCGRLGANLANTLSNSDGNVTIIDKDDTSFRHHTAD